MTVQGWEGHQKKTIRVLKLTMHTAVLKRTEGERMDLSQDLTRGKRTNLQKNVYTFKGIKSEWEKGEH